MVNRCRKCSSGIPEVGFNNCRACLDYFKEYRSKRKDKQVKCNNTNCSNLRDTIKSRYCLACRKLVKAKELCSKCGINTKTGDASCSNWCKQCLAARRRGERAVARGTGTCTLCFKVPALSSRSFCGDCAKKKSLDTVEKRVRIKKFLVESLGGKCQRCGFETPYYDVFDFHHLDPDKKDFDIAKRLTWNFEKLLAEVKKCILICANCHRIEHSGNKKYK